MISENHLIWIDLEMTGLHLDSGDRILEIATVITNNQLEVIAEGPSLVIHQPEDLLKKMDAWNTKYHTKSGLVNAVLHSTISLEQAEHETLEFIKQYCLPHKSPLCGNTVYQDRAFLRRYMPSIDEFAHYRLVDVSTIKELVRRWYPNNPHIRYKKTETHRALPDIYTSIAELEHYRIYFFIENSLKTLV